MVGKEIALLKSVKGKHFLYQKLASVKYLVYLCNRNQVTNINNNLNKYDYEEEL